MDILSAQVTIGVEESQDNEEVLEIEPEELTEKDVDTVIKYVKRFSR